MKALALSRRRWLSGALVAPFAPGCASGNAVPTKTGAAGWVTPFFGASPQDVSVYRLGVYRNDPQWSKRVDQLGNRTVFRILSDQGAAGMAAGRETQIALYVPEANGRAIGDLEMIAVLHEPYPLNATRAEWKALGRAASGVAAFSLGEDQNVQLFILPQGTWVIAAGRAVVPIRNALASDATPPPRTPLASGAFFAQAVTSAVSRGALGLPLQAPERIQLTEVAMYPVPPGQDIPTDVRTTYSDGDASQAAASDLAQRLRAGEPQRQLAWDDESPRGTFITRIYDVHVDGDALVVRGRLPYAIAPKLIDT
jgi:hypothetical protein